MDASPLAPGTVLDDNYRLLRQLGKGGMGEVWEAEHMRLPKRVAIKFLLAAGAGHEELVSRFRREAEIASRLGHPGIVQVFDWNTLQNGTPYLVMERLEGEDLRARLERGPVPLDEAREVVRQVASALDLAHQRGVIHRDLKPENIFLCEEPGGGVRAKVLDFGISKIQGSQSLVTRDDHILGTPGYMAPEQAMGKNSLVDARTDLFALAAIFYEMVTGHSLFLGDTLAEVVYKVVHHSPEPLRDVVPAIPEDVSQAVGRALSKDIQARQPSVRAFADAVLRTGSEGRAPSEPPGSAEVDPVGATVASERVPLTPPARPAGGGSAPRPDQAEIATEVPARRPPRALVGTALVAAPALLGALAWALWPPAPAPEARGTSAKSPPLQGSVDPPPGAEAAPGATRPAALHRPGADAAPPEREPSRPPSVPDTTAPTTPRAARPSRQAPQLPPTVREKLQRAEAALTNGDAAVALRHAKTALYEAKTPRAYAIMARAYCLQHNLGMVRAMLRNLGAGARRRVRAYCKRQGFPIP